MKILPMEAELFHVDRGTDRHDDANSRFSKILETRLKTYQNSSRSFALETWQN